VCTELAFFFGKGKKDNKKAVEQVIDNGVKPILLDLQRVVNFSGDVEGVRTSFLLCKGNPVRRI
jgi:hypothetical protein